MAVAQLTLFGRFELRLVNGRLLDLPGQKDRALLAILALSSGAALSRDKLTGLLWSDRGDTQARDSLKHALKHIRGLFNDAAPEKAGDGLIIADRSEVRLAPDWISVDVIAFEAFVRKGTPETLEEADRLFSGEFLEGIVVQDVGFESWLLEERQRLRRLQEQALTKLLAPTLDTEIRERAASRLLELDPTHETAARILMQIHVERGESTQAVKVFETLRKRLQSDLGMKPEQKTLETYEAIRSGKLSAADTQLAPLSKTHLATHTTGEPDLLGKPSIAVLPFENMSGDPSQEYFADGITEDIITELARYHSLFVIARNSAFQFRGPAVDMTTVRRKLGVRYIAEGSVRRVGDRLRVTAQLIDVATETHLWAERYDRDMQDVFAIEDEVARTIATTLEGRVAASGAVQTKRKPTKDWAAYDFFLQGRAHDTNFDLAAAETCLARAVELDPGYVEAHAFRAIVLSTLYWVDQNPELLQRAEVCARMALSIDDHHVWSHDAMAYVAMHQRKFDLAGVHSSRALRLNSNDILAAGTHAIWLTRVGKPGEALQLVDAAMQRDPFPPTWLWHFRFLALFHLKRYDEAIAAIGNMANTFYMHHAYCASAHAHADRLNEARRELAVFVNAKPGATIALVAKVEPYADPALLGHLLDGLRKAGLPE